jgi:hypothetical protein
MCLGNHASALLEGPPRLGGPARLGACPEDMRAVYCISFLIKKEMLLMSSNGILGRCTPYATTTSD